MNFAKAMDETTGTITFPPEWRDNPDGDWVKHVAPELRQKGGSPSQFMASALDRMPEDHPQRDDVQRVLNEVLTLQQAERSKKESKRAQQYGMTCVVFGLTATPQHNGKEVRLEEWLPDEGRWKCSVTRGGKKGESLGVRPKNLQ